MHQLSGFVLAAALALKSATVLASPAAMPLPLPEALPEPVAAAAAHPPVFNLTLTFHKEKKTCTGSAGVSRLVTERQGCTDSPIAFGSVHTCVAPDQRFQVGPSPAPGCILYTYPEKGCAAPSRNDVRYFQVAKKETCLTGVSPTGVGKSFLLQCNHFN